MSSRDWPRWAWMGFVCLLVAAASRPAHAQDYYYYDPDGLGAHAFYNPQNFIVQGGLGALYDERVHDLDWAGGFSIVNNSLVDPIGAVNDYGWKRFLYREFLPHPGAGQNYVPNWVWHFMGGGMRTKLMEEYYVHRGARHPRTLAWFTMYAYHYLNEAVQAARFQRSRRSTVDAVADMYFFDWAGGLLFQFDSVNRYISKKLHMREWSFQAQFNPVTRRLVNNGQLYWMRRELWGPLSLSFLTGEQITSLNLTVGWKGGRQLSLGVGPKSKAFIARKNGDTDPSGIIFSSGLYYSVDDNPFVILTCEPQEGGGSRWERLGDGEYLLNLYPGVLRVFGQPLGATVAYERDTVFLGLALGALPVGIGVSTP